MMLNRPASTGGGRCLCPLKSTAPIHKVTILDTSDTAYGEAKAHAEASLLQWQSGVRWFTVRPANIWGPYHPSFAGAIWKYIQRRVYLHPDKLKVMRGYGYVRNAAEQIVALMKCDPGQTDRQIFYIADGVADSALWVDSFSLALTGHAARRMKVPFCEGNGMARRYRNEVWCAPTH